MSDATSNQNATTNAPAEKRTWTPELKLKIVNEAVTEGAAATMKKYGVASPQFYTWRKQFGDKPVEAKSEAKPAAKTLSMKKPVARKAAGIQKAVPGYDAQPSVNAKATMTEATNKLLAQGREDVNRMQATVGQLYMENVALKAEIAQLRNEVHAAHTFRD